MSSKKLKHYKINKLSLSWFESYLSHIIQQVNINKNQSKAGNVLCGVPQASTLDHLLFVIFINELPLSIGDSSLSVD